MKLTPNKINSKLYYLDSFLSAKDFKNVQNLIVNTKFNETGKDDKSSIWFFNKPYNPKVSDSIVVTEGENYTELIKVISSLKVYPTNGSIDIIIRSLFDYLKKNSLVGEFGKDWVGMIVSVYEYSNKNRLIWHTDSDNYSGAFTFYAHDKWEKDWGGYFLFKERDKDDSGIFLEPKPNRLVILKSPIPHSISPIYSPENYPRYTVTGFFVKPKRVRELISRFNLYH